MYVSFFSTIGLGSHTHTRTPRSLTVCASFIIISDSMRLILTGAVYILALLIFFFFACFALRQVSMTMAPSDPALCSSLQFLVTDLFFLLAVSLLSSPLVQSSEDSHVLRHPVKHPV